MRTTNPREGRSWPGYMFGGRLRTSTAAMLIVFCSALWLYHSYDPDPVPPTQIPATEVVPPGFIPDPAYTWAPRTDVQRRSPTTTTSPTTTETTPANGSESTSSTPSTGQTASPTPHPDQTTVSTPAPAPAPTPTPSPNSTAPATADQPAPANAAAPDGAVETAPTPEPSTR